MKAKQVLIEQNVQPGPAFITTLLALLLVAVSAIVQATKAGLACPVPILCDNRPLPSLMMIFWLNIVHLVVALIVTGLTVFMARRLRQKQPSRLIDRLVVSTLGVTGLHLLVLSAAIGFSSTPAIRITYQLALALYLTLVFILSAVSYLPPQQINFWSPLRPRQRSYLRLLVVTGLVLLLSWFSGMIVTETGSGTACPDWPLCQGSIFPANASLGVVISLGHRFMVVGVSLLIAAVVLVSCRRYAARPVVVKWAAITGLLFLTQVAVGGWTALMPLPRVVTLAIHLTLTMAIWGSLTVLATRFRLLAGELPETPSRNLTPRLTVRQKAGVYFKLTKPWIMVLLLITTAGAMVIAARGLPSLGLFLLTMFGGALSAGGASVLNSYVDSDIDQLMSRTSRRATVTGLVTPQETLLLGLTLSTLSFFVFALFVNTLSAALSTLGILYYVFFYTLYLKRSTIHNIVIGGAAGAIPPLVGWTAVTGLLDLGAFYLFAIIFFWTPPHTWALALLVEKDYARARVPMLPVVAGVQETTYQIFLYTILLITLTLLPVTFGMLSWIYFSLALALGIPFLYLAWKLWRDYEKRLSKQLYKFSQLYLALLFVLMAVDRSLFL